MGCKKWLLGWVLLWMTGAALAAGSALTLRLCQDEADVYPWTLYGRPGLNNVLLRIAAAKAGVAVEFIAAPWTRCQRDTRAGLVDGMFAISFSRERMDIGVYPMSGDQPDVSKRLMQDGYSLYQARGGKATWDGTRLSVDGLVAAQRGYSVVAQLQALGANVDMGAYPVEANLRKLLAGRVAAVALRTQEADSKIASSREFAPTVEKLPIPLVDKPYYLMLSRPFVQRHGELAQRLWQLIGEVRESVEYREFETAFR